MQIFFYTIRYSLFFGIIGDTNECEFVKFYRRGASRPSLLYTLSMPEAEARPFFHLPYLKNAIIQFFDSR
jgi:hypothetical protein